MGDLRPGVCARCGRDFIGDKWNAECRACIDERETEALGTSTHVGFTGTRHGMTPAQARTVAKLMDPYDWVHHGDCVGADANVHLMAEVQNKKIETHPPSSVAMRAFCKGHKTNPPLPFHIRNRAIVDASCLLIAAPASANEEAPSGTWGTARYAKKRGKPVTVVLPNGCTVAWGAS